MSLNADRTINRAMVAECAISATRNYLKLHMPKTLNPFLCSLHAKTQKLCTRSAMRVAACRPHPWSRQPPVDALRVPDAPTARNSHIASCWRHAFHRGRHQHAILIAPAALSVPHTPRLRALVHFGRRPIRRGDGLVIAGIRNASQNQTSNTCEPDLNALLGSGVSEQ